MLTFISVFAGIGGMDRGLEAAGWRCIRQVESNAYCLSLLGERWPNVPKHDDVRTYTPEYADVIVGGFPCQDVSNAGQRAGISASRSGLYGQMVRCLRVARSPRALLENVAALLVRGMGTVLGDLAEIGYDAEWDCLPASAIGALHHRDRVFITASIRSDTNGVRPQGKWATTKGPWSWEQFEGLVQAEARLSVPAGSSGGMADGVRHRKHRLHALGNAVVPQVAEVIGRAILSAEAGVRK